MLLSIVTGSIEGRVLDQDDLGIGGVAVYLEPEDVSYSLDSPKIVVITNGYGEYSFSDLPPGEYEVGLCPADESLIHPYRPPCCLAPVRTDLLVGVNETLNEVDFECSIPKQTLQIFFLGDDTGSHANVNGAYFGFIDDIIEALQADERFDWEFGVGRFEDFPEFSGDPDDLPFMLNQAIIPDETPNFDSLIDDAVEAENVLGSGGDYPESLNEGLYQSALQAGFSSTSLDSSYCMSVIIAGTDAGTAYQEADPIVDTIYGVQDVLLQAFTADSFNEYAMPRNETFGEGATIQEAVDWLNYRGARVIGIASGDIADNGGPLSAYALATGAVNESESALTYTCVGVPYEIANGEPLVIRASADYPESNQHLAEILPDAILNQVEYRPPLATVCVTVLSDDLGPEAAPESITLVPAAFMDSLEYLPEEIQGYEVAPDGDSAWFQRLLPNEYAVIVNGAVTQTRVWVPSWVEPPAEPYYGAFEQIGPNSWRTWVYAHWAGPQPDVANAEVNAAVSIDVLENDGDCAWVDSFTQPDHGSVARDDDRLRYTPPSGWEGETTFGYTIDGESTTVTVHVGGPRVTSVVVGNSTFSDSIDAGASSAIQLATARVPNGVNQVTLTFDWDDPDFVARDLRVVDATRTQTYWADSCVENSVGQGSSVTWTFSETFADGEMYVWLNDSFEAHSVPLDGEWQSPTDFSDTSGNSAFPSGDGHAGGYFGDDFAFAFTILPGDATRDGIVDVEDFAAFAVYWYSGSPGASWEDGDFTGDGYVDVDDFAILASYWYPYTGIAYWQPPEEMGMRGGGDERSLSRVSVSVDAIFAKYGLDNPDAPKSWLLPGNETFDQFAKDLLDVLRVAI